MVKPKLGSLLHLRLILSAILLMQMSDFKLLSMTNMLISTFYFQFSIVGSNILFALSYRVFTSQLILGPCLVQLHRDSNRRDIIFAQKLIRQSNNQNRLSFTVVIKNELPDTVCLFRFWDFIRDVQFVMLPFVSVLFPIVAFWLSVNNAFSVDTLVLFKVPIITSYLALSSVSMKKEHM